MKIQLFTGIVITTLLISHSGKAYTYQPPFVPAETNISPSLFASSVFFNGIGSFITNIFNSPLYSDFLANNFFHLKELLEHSNQLGKDSTYVNGIFNLFTNKLKSSVYINAYAYLDFISQLSPLIKNHFIIKTDRLNFSLRDLIFEMQYQAFKNNFPEFKSNPDTFLTGLSEQIEEMVELRKKIVIFFEVSLSKLIWSPEDQIETWYNVKAIADQLAHFYSKTIITNLEDLNNLYTTLLERYCFFLELSGTSLEVSTFEKIKQDIENNYISLFDVDEQENLLETKIQRFTRCLLACETKVRAQEMGIIIK